MLRISSPAFPFPQGSFALLIGSFDSILSEAQLAETLDPACIRTMRETRVQGAIGTAEPLFSTLLARMKPGSCGMETPLQIPGLQAAGAVAALEQYLPGTCIGFFFNS